MIIESKVISQSLAGIELMNLRVTDLLGSFIAVFAVCWLQPFKTTKDINKLATNLTFSKKKTLQECPTLKSTIASIKLTICNYFIEF